jgi:hypothetical protein
LPRHADEICPLDPAWQEIETADQPRPGGIAATGKYGEMAKNSSSRRFPARRALAARQSLGFVPASLGTDNDQGPSDAG